VPEDNIKYLTALLKQLKTLANNQPGYISGETLRNFENPNENLVIREKIDLLLGEETKYEIYQYG